MQYIAPSFEKTREAWLEAGRTDSPRLIGIGYYALGDVEKARSKLHDYYIASGEGVVGLVTSGLATTSQAVRDAIKLYEDIGADEYILMPGDADLAEINRLAEIAL